MRLALYTKQIQAKKAYFTTSNKNANLRIDEVTNIDFSLEPKNEPPKPNLLNPLSDLPLVTQTITGKKGEYYLKVPINNKRNKIRKGLYPPDRSNRFKEKIEIVDKLLKWNKCDTAPSPHCDMLRKRKKVYEKLGNIKN